jgi:hypothetical protein
MKTTILATEAFTYTAELRPLQDPPGGYTFSITSTFGRARTPDAERQVFQACLDRAGLLALRDLIDAEVQS